MTFRDLTIILLFLLYAPVSMSQVEKLRMPAEWEKQKSVFVNYSGNPDDRLTTEKAHSVCKEIIRELSFVTTVHVLINEEYKKDSLVSLFSSYGIDTNKIILVPVYKLFTMGVPRDYGPIIVKDTSGKNKIMRFHWDHVGADFVKPDTVWAKRRDFIRDRYFMQMGRLLQMNVKAVPVAIEGGEIDINGEGAALLVDSFTLPRNPNLNKKQLDSMLHLSLGVKKTIWLREGVAEDPGAGRKAKIVDNVYGYGVGGHVDAFARFVDAKTIFLSMPTSEEAMRDPIKKITYDRMKINEGILMQATDQDEKPFNVVYIPVPDVIPEMHVIDTNRSQFPVSALRFDFPEWKHGDSIRFMPAVSYLNFLIFNEVVLIAKYWQPGFPESCRQKDEEVKKIFTTYFPGKKIVQIDSWGTNRVGGGIHCWTQQVPAD